MFKLELCENWNRQEKSCIVGTLNVGISTRARLSLTALFVGAGELGVKNLNDKLGSLGSVSSSASAASDGGDISGLLVLPLLVYFGFVFSRRDVFLSIIYEEEEEYVAVHNPKLIYIYMYI